MTFSFPETFAALGSFCLILAPFLALVDMKGGVNWSQVGAVCAVIGGGGVIGGAGGWLGDQVLGARDTVWSWGAHWGARAGGAGAAAAIVVIALLWAYNRIGSGGAGIEGGGKGKSTKKIRSLLMVGIFAVVGAAVFTIFPQLYSVGDWVTSTVGGFGNSLIA